jgi:hypothetical protein
MITDGLKITRRQFLSDKVTLNWKKIRTNVDIVIYGFNQIMHIILAIWPVFLLNSFS